MGPEINKAAEKVEAGNTMINSEKKEFDVQGFIVNIQTAGAVNQLQDIKK